MFERMRSHLVQQLQEIRDAGLEKPERVIGSPQGSTVAVMEHEVLNLCANNYLGLADHPEVVKAAKEALDRWGYGMASVRFICGTTDLHKQLEARIAKYLGMEDSILFAACFDANGAVFEPLYPSVRPGWLRCRWARILGKLLIPKAVGAPRKAVPVSE